MLRVELKELQANLDYYFDKLDEGESIEVLENGQVLYTLTEPFIRSKTELVTEASCAKKDDNGKRVLGQHKGLFEIPVNFNDPLPQDVLDSFEKAPILSPRE